jgi:hypothetical protein
MFRITAFCEDKNLVKFHHAALGLLMNLEVVPVSNGKVANGKAQPANSGNLEDQFRDFVKQQHLKIVHAQDIKAFCRHTGRSEGGYSTTLTRLISGHVLKRMPKNGKAGKFGYKVIA